MDANKKQSYRTPALRSYGTLEELGQRVLNLSEVASYLHIHRSTAYRMVQSGELPGFKIGSDWRFNLEDIDNWRLTRTQSTTSVPRNGSIIATKIREQPNLRR